MDNKKLTILLMNVGIFTLANQHTLARASIELDEKSVTLKKTLPREISFEQLPLFQEFDELKDFPENKIANNHCCGINCGCKPNPSCGQL